MDGHGLCVERYGLQPVHKWLPHYGALAPEGMLKAKPAYCPPLRSTGGAAMLNPEVYFATPR